MEVRPGHQRDRRRAVVAGAADRRQRQVPGGGVGDHPAGPDHGLRPGPHEPAYEAEDVELHEDAKALAEAHTMRTHSVIVLVDNLDAAAARAIQYARTLQPDELRAVHFDLDPWKTGILVKEWGDLGFSGFPLDILECPDRRMPRAAVETAQQILRDGDTELTVLIPRHEYTKLWHHLLHDRSSNSISSVLSDMPHCNVTIVPYHLGTARLPVNEPVTTALPDVARTLSSPPNGAAAYRTPPLDLPDDRVRIAEIPTRHPVSFAGRVRAMRIQPWGGNPALECVVADETGSIVVVFFGRREIGGVRLGTLIRVEGVVGEHRGRRTILNPRYTLIATPTSPRRPNEH